MDLSKINEEAIINGCLNDWEDYQFELFNRYSERLLSTCFRYTGDKETSKDVLQEAFILIFKHLKKYDKSKASLYTWMNKICINESLKMIKSNYLLIDFNNYVGVESESFELSILQKMELDEVVNQIAKLPEPYRTVFNLFEVEGYKHEEIANYLQIKESSSRSILHRAKKILIDGINANNLKESWI